MKIATRNALTAVLAATTFAGTASATVKHEGKWPAAEAPVSLDATNLAADDAIKRLADAAGWSLVVKSPDEGDQHLTLHVKNQQPSKVLDLILSSGDYVAKRDGTIVSIERASGSDDESDEKNAKSIASAALAAAASAMNAHSPMTPPTTPPAPLALPTLPTPPTPPTPPTLPNVPTVGIHEHHRGHHHGADRTVTGGHLTIEKGETVGDVTVLGGSVDVFGNVEGDLAVFGGSAHLHDGGEVHGDAVTLGGSVEVDDGAAIDGDVTRIGGSLHSGTSAHIGGTSRDDKGGLSISVSDDDDAASSTSESKPEKHAGRSFLQAIGTMLTESSLLFVFGAVLLALATKRMDSLKVEVASRPMRSFALGVVGSLVGLVALCVLCITVIGIPLAIVGALGLIVAIYGSITAVLTTVGQALLGHKTTNPYVHLAVGCVLLFVGSSIPWVGGFLIAAVVLTSIGALVATRAAGFVPPRVRITPTDPYRSTAG
jgi:hypothetical protein